MRTVAAITFAIAWISPTLAQQDNTTGIGSTAVPGTGGYLVVGPEPPKGNPGQQVTVSPNTFSTGGDNRTRPDTAYGATVTIPLGTLEKKR